MVPNLYTMILLDLCYCITGLVSNNSDEEDTSTNTYYVIINYYKP